MSKEAVTVEELLKKGEADFDSFIKTMPAKALMEFISRLQKEMTKEQGHFDTLNAELKNRKERNSRQSKQISKDMVQSQQRLALLMNRSMKCFSQQNTAPSSNQGTQLGRRNSAKGTQPVTSPGQKTTNVHRSRSLHAVNKASELTPMQVTPVITDPARPITGYVGGASTTTHQPIIRSTVNGNANNSVTHVSGKAAMIAKASSQGNLSSGPAKGSSSKLTPGDGAGVGGVTSHPSKPPPSSSLSSSSISSSPSPTADSVGAGGMYVKRRQGHPGKVSSSSAVTSLPPRRPASSSYTPLSSSRSSNVVILKSSQSRPASFVSSSQSPLEIARSRAGVSQSQTTIGQAPVPSDPPKDGGSVLPSVRQLAKSFGSTSALNTATPATSTSSGSAGKNRSSAGLLTGKPVARSHSNVYFDDSKKSNSTANPVSLTKGKTAVAKTTVMNGKATSSQLQPPHVQRVNTPRSASTENLNGPSELERARARLKSNRNSREISAEISTPAASNGVVNSSNAATTSQPSNVNSSGAETVDEAKQKEQRIAQNIRVGTYVKKSAPQAPTSSNTTNNDNNLQPASSAKPTMVTISASSSSAKRTPAPATEAPGTTSSLSSKNGSANMSSAASSSTLTVISNNSSSSSSSNKKNTNTNSSSSSPLRHSKSKEELVSAAKGQRPVPDRSLMLKQIESRRTDFDQPDGVYTSAIKMSSSMPSLDIASKCCQLVVFRIRHLCIVWSVSDYNRVCAKLDQTQCLSQVKIITYTLFALSPLQENSVT